MHQFFIRLLKEDVYVTMKEKKIVLSTNMIGFSTFEVCCINDLHIIGTIKVLRWILKEDCMLL